jgi:hypothetical protein
MLFQPIEINGLNTFIVQSKVSDEAVEQAINTFNVLIPHAGLTGNGVNPEKKDSLDVSVVPNTVLIEREIREIVGNYCEYYSLDKFVAPLDITEHINIQKYPLKGAYHSIHADRGWSPLDMYRELVFMTYLNTIHSGGETEFMFYKLKIKPEKGLTLVWPAGWTHAHRGLPAPTAEKIILTGWFSPSRNYD